MLLISYNLVSLCSFSTFPETDKAQWKIKQGQILTIHIQFVGFLSVPSRTSYFARVSTSIRRLRLKDLQEVASVNILSLPVGQDGLSISIPGDSGGWDPTPFTLQCYHGVQQGCDVCGCVPPFDGGRDWRKGKMMCMGKFKLRWELNSKSFNSLWTLRLKSLDSLPAVFMTLHW